ncbi:MAG: DEAD/DEAH box helicase [Gemmatimonadetes bacterium]|nr:DEAD/DEAH box helicase [Gemmatimonadota bacterium]
MTIDRGFAALGLDPRLTDALAGLGYEEPTPVQQEAIPTLLAGRDVLARAATGTGKTAAFALPMLHQLADPAAAASPRGAPRALVLVPTRELAMQVTEAVQKYGRALGVRALALYGGAPMATQLRTLARGVDVVVATPGRALDHIRRETLPLGAVRMVVLDEADEMLDMGFADDLEAILQAAPAARQTALFSATFPPRIAAIAQQQLRDPVEVTIARAVDDEGEAARVRQVAVRVLRGEKVPALLRLLEVESPTAAIVFCRTRTEVDELTEALQTRGARAEALHGGLSQEQRDRVMQRFRAQKTALLVATDVAARGLDVSHVSHVVNFDVPADVASYVHRIGRTGRAGREGVAITLAEPREQRLLRVIEQVTRCQIAPVPVPGNAALRAHRETALRARLAAVLADEAASATLAPWLELLAPLLEAHDGAALAAAALVLLGAPLEVTEPEVGAAAARPELTRAPRIAGRPLAPPRPSRTGAPMTRLWVGGGHALNIRPGDLVGAIANETGVDASVIGAIHIGETFSTVEVPEAVADTIVAALQGRPIKGRKVPVRRDRSLGGPPVSGPAGSAGSRGRATPRRAR